MLIFALFFSCLFFIWYYLVLFLFYVKYSIDVVLWYPVSALIILGSCFMFFIVFSTISGSLSWFVGFCVMLTAHISFVVVSTADCMMFDFVHLYFASNGLLLSLTGIVSCSDIVNCVFISYNNSIFFFASYIFFYNEFFCWFSKFILTLQSINSLLHNI